MTEQEWLACTDPTPMLEFLRGKVSDRKLRLFAVACCRRIRQLMSDERSKTSIEVAERFADGKATEQERESIHSIAGLKGRRIRNHPIAWTSHDYAIAAASDATNLDAYEAADTARFSGQFAKAPDDETPYGDPVLREEALAQANFVRDIFGPSPFRHVTLNPAWLTATAEKLAEAISEEKAFDRMPILGDALEDAGCTNQEILAHCRQPGEHVRGCWVIDLVLGKE